MKKLILCAVAMIIGLSLFARQAKPQPDYLNSIKITFLSWLSGSTKISYERALPKVRQSSEICGSLICAGYDKYRNNPVGYTVSALLGTVGYQYVYKRFLADLWFGGGYAFGTPAETGYHHGFELWHWFNAYHPNIAMSFSIRLGICF